MSPPTSMPATSAPTYNPMPDNTTQAFTLSLPIPSMGTSPAQPNSQPPTKPRSEEKTLDFIICRNAHKRPILKESRYGDAHITAHSPSFCLPTLDLEMRSLVFGAALLPPRLRSSSRSRAFGKFCAWENVSMNKCLERKRVHTSSSPIPSLCIF
jgi:hypothetical protein